MQDLLAYRANVNAANKEGNTALIYAARYNHPEVIKMLLLPQTMQAPLDVDAQNKLGLCYEYGDGVEKNKTEAMKWFRKAAEQGDDFAKKELAELETPVAEKDYLATVKSKVNQLRKKYGAATVNDMMKTGEIKVGHTMAFLNDYANVYGEYQRTRTPYMNGIGSDAFKRYNLEFRTKEPTERQMMMYGRSVRVVNAVSNVIGVEATFYIVNSKVVGVYAGGLGTMKDLL